MENQVFIKQGDIIVFDNLHKIYCGDCTKKESYEFLDNELCTLTFTSPPYNMGFGNYSKKGGKCDAKKYLDKDDDKKSNDDYFELINSSLQNALSNSKYVFYNIQHVSGNKITLIDWMYLNKEKLVDTIIWKKTTTMPLIEPNVLNSDFEYIYIFTNIKNNGKHIRIGQEFRGTISNVIECKRNSQNEYAKIHSALFPLELCNKIITTFTNENDKILDVFSGLGTNLIACKLNNRIYRGIELSPFYCQETIKRYLKYDTGRNIKIIRDGQTISFDEFKNYIIDDQLSIFDL